MSSKEDELRKAVEGASRAYPGITTLYLYISREANWWDKLLNVITFGIYDLPETTLIIESSIENSSVYYYVANNGSTTALTESELNDSTFPPVKLA